MNEDQKIVALAIDLICSVTDDTIQRKMKGDRHSDTVVSWWRLTKLVEAIERGYPGAIAEVRDAKAQPKS